MRGPEHRKSNRRTRNRPGRFSVILVGVVASIASLFLEYHGISWKYSDRNDTSGVVLAVDISP